MLDDPDRIEHACPLCGGHMELGPEHAGREIPCPHCHERFTPSEAVLFPDPRPASKSIARTKVEGTAFACPNCGNYMDLLPAHLGRDVPCPHCGKTFVPTADDARRRAPHSARSAPVARSRTLQRSSSVAKAALVLGIVGLVGSTAGFMCCQLVGLPMMLCGPIGLWLSLRERGAARNKGEEPDPDLKPALVTSMIATVLFVLVTLYLVVMFSVYSGAVNLRGF